MVVVKNAQRDFFSPPFSSSKRYINGSVVAVAAVAAVVFNDTLCYRRKIHRQTYSLSVVYCLGMQISEIYHFDIGAVLFLHADGDVYYTCMHACMYVCILCS